MGIKRERVFSFILDEKVCGTNSGFGLLLIVFGLLIGEGSGYIVVFV